MGNTSEEYSNSALGAELVVVTSWTISCCMIFKMAISIKNKDRLHLCKIISLLVYLFSNRDVDVIFSRGYVHNLVHNCCSLEKQW